MFGEKLDGSNEKPCGGRGNSLLEVLGETAVAVQPGQGALDHPLARQEFEALGHAGSLDDLNDQFADAAQRLPRLVSGIAAIGEEMAQPREAGDHFGEQHWSPVVILDVGGVDQGMD